ncbi:tetratricopeptide repeat protein [Roseobacter sp.]|uniref:tetratricopeptide repeat protein n=1 Tax=Roseobacter sp. TaxID=1907202 RepID=UPI00385A40BC
MMRILLGAVLLLPTSLLAAGGDNDEPPIKPAITCEGAQVFDERIRRCVDPKASSLERDQLYQTVRYLAYAGRYRDAQVVMDAMEADDPGRLTYMGFTHRKMGNIDLANLFYEEAIDKDPANVLARSYMGQGLVAAGDLAGAIVQLRAIKEHGGAGSWSEASLRKSIETGSTYGY